MTRKSSGEFYAQIRAEASNPRGDVWWGGTGDPHVQAAQENLTLEYRSPLLAELHPWAVRQAEQTNYRTVGIYSGALGYSYNVTQLQRRNLPVPRCWSDLLNSAFRDEIQVADPNSSGTAYTMLATLVQIMGEDPELFTPAGGDFNNMAADWGLDNLGVFVQDSWSVNNNLTLTYALRIDTPYVNEEPIYNPAEWTAFRYDNSTTIDGEELFQPRFGFNYNFDTERATQMRGGLGLFQGASATVWLSNPYSNNGLSYTDYVFNTGITRFDPDPAYQLGLFTPGAGATQSIDFIDPELAQPEAWKANLALDNELPWWGMVATAEVILTSVEEGIYYEQLNLGSPTAVGQDGRMIYWNANGRNPANWNQQGAGTSVTALQIV